MDTINTARIDGDELSKQEAYAEALKAKGFDFGLVVGSAFVESMRNTYYRHTGTALDEIIDNSIEAGASNIHIALGHTGSDAKPDAIAIIDDGHGMVPTMIRLAVTWGGTHREDSRSGFGRFGFGLPSASVNQARRFSVYSITGVDGWHGVTIDLDHISAGKYNDPNTGRVVVPEVTKASPPSWIQAYIKKHYSNEKLEHGTVVLWERLDRLSWKTNSGLTKNLLEHFGVTYRNYLRPVDLVFNEIKVEPTDPLFVTPGFRYFDSDEDRALALEPAEIDVAVRPSGEKVRVRIRYAQFPLSFFAIDKSKRAGRGNLNPRFSVMTDNFGIIVCRMGRQLDVVERTPWPGLEKFGNNDRYWAAEIDFPAGLDEEFTVSNSKQGVVLSERFWDLLKQAGMENALRQLRRDIDAEQKAESVKTEPTGEKRLSERAMEEGEKFRRTRVGSDPVERANRAREALEQLVKRTARDTGRSETQVRMELETDAKNHPYRVIFEYMLGAPFFRVEQIGGMQVLKINRAHRFYADLYAAPGNTRRVKAGLEVLLFAIGDCELDAQGNPDRRTFYASERTAWSETLATSLDSLDRFVHETDIIDGEPTGAGSPTNPGGNPTIAAAAK